MPDAIDDILKKTFPFLLVNTPAIFMLIFVITLGLIYSVKNRNRKNPLTQKLLRSPGETLLGLITELQFKVIEVVFLWCILPTFAYVISLNAIAAQKSAALLLAAISIAILISVYGALRAYFMLKRLADLRLAYDGELSVGQELNELMFNGFRVYHDIQAEDFNIDHAVVGPSGVFAIEAKTRSKKLQAKGAEAVEVLYDGDSINFPHWRDTKILEQARGNALWLSRDLRRLWAIRLPYSQQWLSLDGTPKRLRRSPALSFTTGRTLGQSSQSAAMTNPSRRSRLTASPTKSNSFAAMLPP